MSSNLSSNAKGTSFLSSILARLPWTVDRDEDGPIPDCLVGTSGGGVRHSQNPTSLARSRRRCLLECSGLPRLAHRMSTAANNLDAVGGRNGSVGRATGRGIQAALEAGLLDAEFSHPGGVALAAGLDHFALDLLQPAPCPGAAQGLDGALQQLRREALLFVHQHRCQQLAVAFAKRKVHGMAALRARVEQRLQQGFGSQAFVQMLLAEGELGLPGGVEGLVRTLPGGGLEGPRRHLRGSRQGTDQKVLCGGNLALGSGFNRGRGPGPGSVAQFLAEDAGIDADAVRNFLRQLVANDATRHPLNVWQQVVQGLDFALGATDGKLGAGALDQVVEVLLRTAQGFFVSGFSLAAEEQIG